MVDGKGEDLGDGNGERMDKTGEFAGVGWREMRSCSSFMDWTRPGAIGIDGGGGVTTESTGGASVKSV